MSDSTREKTPRESPTDPGANAIAPELGRTSPWWIGSVTVHALVLLAILLFSPLRTIILQPGKAAKFETTAGADRIQQVVSQIRDRQAEEISFQVEELLDIEDDLEDIRDAKFDSYDELARDLARQAPGKALAAQDEALKAQQRALEQLAEARDAQGQVDRAQADVHKAQAADDHDRAIRLQETAQKAHQHAVAAHGAARDAQRRADEAQAKAEQALAMLGGPLTGLRELQAAATKAQGAADADEQDAAGRQEQVRGPQDRARQKQASARDRADEVRRKTPDVRKLQDEADRAADEAQKAKEAGQQADRKQRAAKAAQDRANRAVRAAKADKAQAQAAADEAQKRAEQARDAAQAARNKLRAAEQRAREAKGRLNGPLRELNNAANRLKADTAQARQIQAQAADAQKKAAQAAGKARQAQVRAKEAQQRARAAVARAVADARPVVAAKARPPDAARSERRPDLRDLNVADLYELAVKAEQRTTETYKHVRAAELAMIREIPLPEAMDQTDVARPIRPELDRRLLTAPVRDLATADRHKKEVETAVREIESMVTLGRRLLSLADSKAGEGGAPVSTDWYRALAAQQEELTRGAMEDDRAVAKDISSLMRQAMGGGREGGDESGTASAGGAATGRGADSGRGRGGGGRPGAVSGPPVVKRDLKAIPGRKVMAGGLPSEWMYVDSWYVIGPFPNPRRINRDKKFPPESVVDLDARYVGRDGKVVRWEFMQTSEPMVLPPDPQEYAIYYAYTELWFEKPMDLWIAVGSDDKSSLWVEDQPVWVSSNRLKGWQIAEGLRKVHFKRGRNRILYRIENGWRHVAWSLLIHTKPRR
jgi:hypothetical protein